MNPMVFDASALLTAMFEEPGTERVMEFLAQPGGEISAVNWSEAGAKLAERGLKEAQIARELHVSGLDVVPFDEAQANTTAAPAYPQPRPFAGRPLLSRPGPPAQRARGDRGRRVAEAARL